MGRSGKGQQGEVCKMTELKLLKVADTTITVTEEDGKVLAKIGCAVKDSDVAIDTMLCAIVQLFELNDINYKDAIPLIGFKMAAIGKHLDGEPDINQN